MVIRARPRLSRGCRGELSTARTRRLAVRLKTANGAWPCGMRPTVPQGRFVQGRLPLFAQSGSGLGFESARVLMPQSAHDREGTAVYCVTWTYAAPPHLTEAAIRNQFDNVGGNYLAVPGLIRKYFGFSDDATSVVGIYLWETKDAADEFYSDEWLSGVTGRWGAAPVKQEWIVPVVAESVGGRVVGAAAPTPG